jgi:hypothetical protein
MEIMMVNKETVVKYALKKQQIIWIVNKNVVDVFNDKVTATWKDVLNIVLHALIVMVSSQKKWNLNKL